MPWVIVGRGGSEASAARLRACYAAAKSRGLGAITLATLEIPRTMQLRSGRRLAECYIIAIQRRATPGAPRKRRRRRQLRQP